ncbi:MAG: tRNA (guanosine(37)-N1)-methyltransferase TrmD [Rickettsiales bacterium]|nr:tRNA (guanosine(37)-N1)-methyltransferase TrmD [Rickettsiales bacterium]
MIFNILTVLPDAFPGYLGLSNAGKALTNGLWQLNIINIRDFATDNYKTVDDTPYAGGSGMVLKCDVVGRAIESIPNWKDSKLVYMSPRGLVFNQQMAHDFAESFSGNDTNETQKIITILCGHFEGVDQRILDYYGFAEISIGDYVLSGGEPAAIVFIDSILRNIDGVLGNLDSIYEESFEYAIDGMLEYPHYTRPAIWKNLLVPEVLTSGNHAEIKAWRISESQKITSKNRPDLLLKRMRKIDT